MKIKGKHMVWGVVIVAMLAFAAWGPIVSNVEQPKYTVVSAQGNAEVRDYPPVIVAEVEVEGEREVAINAGFRLLADYIFGNNTAARKVAMTAPVTQTENTAIAMTAPVTQQAAGSSWRVRFVMPAEYALDTLPIPRNPQVKLKQEAARRVAVIRFSGRATAESLATRTGELLGFVEMQKLRTKGEPVLAFYNPPWTLPFLRRNEVMIEVGAN